MSGATRNARSCRPDQVIPERGLRRQTHRPHGGNPYLGPTSAAGSGI
jgi:hypothetical protein